MAEHHIDKQTIEADLFLTDGTAISGIVYIETASPLLDATQDLLGTERRLIPCRGESGELILIGRRAISALRFEFAGTGPAPTPMTVLPSVTTVAGGHRFEGVLHIPSEDGRISDLLNDADRWMLLVAGDRGVWIDADKVIKHEAP